MKKVLFMIAAVICAALTSCSNDEFNEQGKKSNQNIKFNIDVASITSGTRAIKQGWTEGDKLNIWFNNNTQQTPDLVLTYEAGEWETGDLRDGIDESYFTDSCDILAYYEACNDLSEYKYNDGQFSRTVTHGGTGYSQIPMYVYGYAKYGFDKYTVSATIKDWLYDADMQVVVTGLTGDAGKYTLACDQLRAINYFMPNGKSEISEVGTPVAGVKKDSDEVAFYFSIKAALDQEFTFTLTDYTDEANPVVLPYTTKEKKTLLPGLNKCIGIKIASTSFATPVTSITLNRNTLSLGLGLSATLTVENVEPADATDKTVTWSSSNESVATVDKDGKVTGIAVGEATITATANDGSGVSASCTVTVTPTGSATVSGSTGRTSCGWVQLWDGGPKFAEFNVGATITDYGNLASGADATTGNVAYYNTANCGGLYPWHNSTLNGRNTTWTSSVTTGTGDVATALWGDKWREPTKDELTTLTSTDNCTWTWCNGSTTKYCDGCTLAGYKVSGKVGTDYENNSIFLPVAGYFNPNFSEVVSADDYATYWSGTPKDNDNANSLYFYSSNKFVGNDNRKFGYSVRAVLAE